MVMVLGIAACDDLVFTTAITTTSTTNSTDSSNSDATTTTTTLETTTTSTESTTTDYRHLALQAEYESLRQVLPFALLSNIVLPNPTNEAIDVIYSVGEQILTDKTLYYQAMAYDQEIPLKIVLSYEEVILENIFVIIQVRNEALYHEAERNLVFETLYYNILEAFPTSIVSDFTIPEIDTNGALVSITIDEPYQIFQNRFLFTFPEQSEVVHFDIRIIYDSELRYYDIPVTMKAFDELPQIPEIYITTQNNAPITNNFEYVPGSITVKTYDQNLIATTVLANAQMEIRVRGNSTAFMPKLPYKIKFTTKTALLSDYAQKDWVLLANFTDQTLIRNYLAYNMARNIGMEYTPSAKFVDVYLNGSYQGNYMLTDQIEISPNRINIEEGSSALDTGYLVEFDRRLGESEWNRVGVEWFNLYGIYFGVKSLDANDPTYSINQLYYIEDYFNTLLLTLQAKQDYTHLIDEASFIDWFIVSEVFKNVDSGYSSVYYYKDAGEVLKMGPVWDFDLSTGNQGHLQWDQRIPEGWYTALEYKNIFFYYLMKYPVFTAHLKARWNEIYEEHILGLLDQIYPAVDSIAKSRHENFERWDIIGKNQEWYTAPEVYDLKTYEEQVWFLYHYLEVRIAWMNTNIQYL